MSLNVRATLALLATDLVIAAFVLGAAGTFDYWQAWAFLVLFGGSSLAVTVYLMKYDPQLLERRLNGGPTAETSTVQKIAVSLVSLGFVAILVVSGLDRRFGWSDVPAGAAIAGGALIVVGITVVFFVMRENPFTSATIELAADQRVISSGPYAVVRHPMYAGASLYLLGIPLALGSWWGVLAVLLMMPALLWRLFDEEAFLSKSLAGYSDYTAAVRYRLVPFIW